MFPDPFELMLLCWQKISVSQHEIGTLGLMENVQFCILFLSHGCFRGFGGKNKGLNKKTNKPCHMAVRLFYTVSNYSRKCCLTYTP